MNREAGGERCPWCGSDPLYMRYHDLEWGVPIHDDRTLFEFLTLEGAQAGLSWITILRKRERYRAVFDNFEPQLVAGFDERKVAELLGDPGIVRNRLKIGSTVGNAGAFLGIQEQFGSFDSYLWRFVDGTPIQNSWSRMDEVPASTPLSDAISRDLKRHGFRFVGSTIVYSLMQAVGLVNDHLTGCRRWRELGGSP